MRSTLFVVAAMLMCVELCCAALSKETPSFATFSREKAEDLKIELKGTAETYHFLGFGKTDQDELPTDVAICFYADAFKECVDASCDVGKKTCTARAKTIFTTNTLSTSGATLVRPLKSGDVPLVEGTKMNVIWATDKPATAPTKIEASAANGVTYKLAVMDLPAVGANSVQTIVPPVLVAVLASFLFMA